MSLPTFKKCLLATAFTVTFGMMQPAMASSEQTTAPEKTNTPNVVFILADDMGYADAGFYDGTSEDVQTDDFKYITKIGQNGAIFTAGYVTAPVCGPSRAGMLTGRYQESFGYYSNTSAYTLTADVVPGIPLGIDTIGDHFQAMGYTTGFIGKYHDGDPTEYWPHNRGFNEFFGFNNGATAYSVGERNIENSEETPNSSMWRSVEAADGTKTFEVAKDFPEYLTDKFGKEAVKFIERNKDEPFFLYVPFNAIHTPLKALEEDLARFAHIEDEDRRKVVAMNYNLDKNVGRIYRKLKKENLLENTIFIFMSDNGGKPSSNRSSNHPLRGAKSQVWEGGIRVPLAISWPGKIPAKQKIDDPVISLDILPTVLTAVGADVSNLGLHGVDLMPRLTGQVDKLDSRFLFWDRVNKAAIRDDEWKMIKLINKKTKYELYKINEDIAEVNELSKEYPEQLERMKQALIDWQETNEEPQWGGNPEDFPYFNEDYRGGSH